MEIPLVLCNGMFLSFDVPQGRQCLCGVNLQKHPCHFSIPVTVTDLVTCFEMLPSGKVIQCFFNLTQTQVNYGRKNVFFIVIINIHFTCSMKTNWMLVVCICSVPVESYTRYSCKTVGKYGDIVNDCSYITQQKQLWNLSLKKKYNFFQKWFSRLRAFLRWTGG